MQNFARVHNLSSLYLQQELQSKRRDPFAFLGVFQFTLAQPLPLPRKQRWTRVSRKFFRGSTLYRVGGSENCKKISKRIHCFTTEPRMTKKYKYCITVPRTFVHDCSLLPWVPACGRIFWGRHQADTSSAERLSHKWEGRDKKRVTMKSLAPRVLCRFIDSPFRVLLCPLVVQISLDTLATTG